MEDEKKNKNSHAWELFGSIMVGVVVLFVAGCIVFAVYDFFRGLSDVKKQGEEVTVSTVSLRSINYQNVLEGSFTLGCGKLDGQDYYTCYQVLDDGGLKLIKFKAEQTVIYETLTQGDAYAEISVDGWGFTKEIKLYVPQDTIQTEYDFGVGD